jgi:hypothetical protein
MTGLGQITIVVALVVTFVLGPSAADLKGMDVVCSAKIMKEGEAAAKAHTRECVLKESCAKSGYGLYTQDGKFIVFDAVGNQTAQKALEACKRKTTLS